MNNRRKLGAKLYEIDDTRTPIKCEGAGRQQERKLSNLAAAELLMQSAVEN